MSVVPRFTPVTCQPSASKRSAIARPMPELLPVTTACGRSFGTVFPLGGLRDPIRCHAHMADVLPEDRVGEIQRAVGALPDRRVRILAIDRAGGIIAHAIAVAGFEVALPWPGQPVVRGQRDGHRRPWRAPERPTHRLLSRFLRWGRGGRGLFLQLVVE